MCFFMPPSSASYRHPFIISFICIPFSLPLLLLLYILPPGKHGDWAHLRLLAGREKLSITIGCQSKNYTEESFDQNITIEIFSEENSLQKYSAINVIPIWFFFTILVREVAIRSNFHPKVSKIRTTVTLGNTRITSDIPVYMGITR